MGVTIHRIASLAALLAGALLLSPRPDARAAEEIDEDESEDIGIELPLPPVPSDPGLREQWISLACDAAIAAAPALARADVGAVVLDIASGRVLWQHDGDRALSLASVTKVLTTAAALEGLGPGFRWRTSLLAEELDAKSGVIAGDLHVRPRGDPTLTMAGLRDLARQLAWRGVRRIDGTLVIDGSYFADDGPPPHFDDQPNERAGYRAPVASSSLERNAVTVIVVADPGGGPASISLDPPGGDYVRLGEAAVVSVTRGRSRIRVDSEEKDGVVTLRVSGQLDARDGVYFARRRVEAPDRLLAAGLRAALAEAGIRVRGTRLGHGPTPPGARLLADHTSETLGEIVRDMNKNSDNFLAESVLKTLGAEVLARETAAAAAAAASAAPPGTPAAPPPAPRSASWTDGQRAVARYLTGTAGLAPASFRVENGSGLYDASEVSAHAVARVLAAAHRDLRVGPEMMASLSIAGVDGTLRKRLRAPGVRARVRGKTGTLAAVSTLAGYAGVDTGRPLAFAVLVNRMPAGQRAAARTLQDSIAAIAVRATTAPAPIEPTAPAAATP